MIGLMLIRDSSIFLMAYACTRTCNQQAVHEFSHRYFRHILATARSTPVAVALKEQFVQSLDICFEYYQEGVKPKRDLLLICCMVALLDGHVYRQELRVPGKQKLQVETNCSKIAF